MENVDALDEILSCRLDTARKPIQPSTVIIFGASGDLTARKLIPALYHLYLDGQLPDPFRVIGVARREKSHDGWREEMRQGLESFSKNHRLKPSAWSEFANRLLYCQGDLSSASTYQNLARMLDDLHQPALRRNLLFYLAISPSHFGIVASMLSQAGLLTKDNPNGHSQRLVVEKPFGHDLASARALNDELIRVVHEKQIYRIDHYLGKETVQNILLFRFSNAIFEQLWDRHAIDHVQLTVSETLGVGNRGGYYEEAGALRDMVQNHLLQVLALIAMEPPVALEAEAIRDEKVKLLKSIRPLLPQQVAKNAVRGQYLAGLVAGEKRPAYREELKVNPDSNIETFAALRIFIDNWRWSQVPFFLRTGKNLPISVSEVHVQFRPTPNVLFAAQCGPKLNANAITMRLQPNEGISLRFNGKTPGTGLEIRQVGMHFNYDLEFGAYTPEAYERLLLEALAGDATLFIRRDEVETSWGIVDPVRQFWANQRLTQEEFYSAGTWGPTAAERLFMESHRAWHIPESRPNSIKRIPGEG